MNRLSRVAIVAATWCLPFVPVRVPLIGGSLPVAVFGIAGVIGVVSYVTTSGMRPMELLDGLDLVLVLHIALSALSTFWSPSPWAPIALLKSSAYFASYVGLKCLLVRYRAQELLPLVRLGALGGIGTLLVGAVIAAERIGLENLLSGPFGYWTFTYVLFREALAGDATAGFTGADVMINAVGEGAAMFAVLLLVGSSGRWTGAGRHTAFALASLLAVLTFSRRAVLALVAALAGRVVAGSATPQARLLRLIALAAAGVFVVAASEVAGGFFDDPTRVAQAQEVYSAVADAPLTGVGYASRVSGDRYVHNFPVGNLYALGIPGFLVAVAIVGVIAVRLVRGVVVRRDEIAPLLVFPLAGLAVASTVEGIMTLANWFVLALYWRLSIARTKVDAHADR